MPAQIAAPIPVPPRSAVPAVDLAFAVLEQMAAAGPGSPTEIARARNLSRIGVTRVLQALLLRGYVSRNLPDNRYALTAKLFALATQAPPVNFAAAARPHLERLCSQTRETAELALLDDDMLLLVDAVDSPQPIRLFTRPGSRESLYRQATGKAILAELEPARITQLFQASKLTAKPEYAPRSLKALFRELQAIRTHGFATDGKRSATEVERIAAPIYGPGGGVLGAVGIAGPASRVKISTERIRQVQAAARAIEQSLGARP